MGEIWIRVLLSDPLRTREELLVDVCRALAARGALKRLVAASVVLKVEDGQT